MQGKTFFFINKIEMVTCKNYPLTKFSRNKFRKFIYGVIHSRTRNHTVDGAITRDPEYY